MTIQAPTLANAVNAGAAAAEDVKVTVTPAQGHGANVFSVQITIDQQSQGGSLVRTSPRELAYQTTPEVAGK